MKLKKKIFLLEYFSTAVLLISLLFISFNFVAINRYQDVAEKYLRSCRKLHDIEIILDKTYYEVYSSDDFSKDLTRKVQLFKLGYTDLKKDLFKLSLPAHARVSLSKIFQFNIDQSLNKEEIKAINDRYKKLTNDNEQLKYKAIQESIVILSIEEKSNTQQYQNIDNYITLYNAKKKPIETYYKTMFGSYNEVWELLQPSLNKNIATIVICSLISLTLIIGAAIIFSRNLSQRILSIGTMLAKVATGEFSSRIEVRNEGDEIGKLIINFNHFIDALWIKLESIRQIMYDMGESVSNEIDINNVEKSIAELSLRNTSADGAALFRINTRSKTLSLVQGIGDFRPPYISESIAVDGGTDIVSIIKNDNVPIVGNILGETATSGKSIFIKNVGINRPELRKDILSPLYIASCITIPLRVSNAIHGVLCLVKTKGYDYFSDLEFSNMQSFSEVSAIALDNLNNYAEMLDAYELNREIGIASDIQSNLVPPHLPKLPNYNIGFLYDPLKGINGDFFDFFKVDEHKTLLFTCEVAGKGVPAALIMVMIRTLVRLITTPEKEAGEILTELNNNITDRTQIENYAALMLLILDKKTNKVSFSSAAQPSLSLLKASDTEFLPLEYAKGMPLGIESEIVYETATLNLEKGDMITVFTDGIPEARNKSGHPYKVESLYDLIQQEKDSALDDIIDVIREDIEYFESGTKKSDDKTLFLIKYKGEVNEN